MGKKQMQEHEAGARGTSGLSTSGASASVPAVSAPPLQSASLQRAALRERDRILADARRIEQRLERLEQERERLRDEVRALHGHLAVLDQVLQGRPTGAAQSASSGVVLRGARLREEATRVLLERAGPNVQVHYAKWHDWMIDEGFVVLGARPKSTFLTGASRSVLVRRADEPGMYFIDLGQVDLVQRDLEQARAELAEVDREIAGTSGPASRLRSHRTGLLATIRKLEGQLEESQRAIDTAQRARRRRVRAA
jgi:septal ring factor EnvC (AmiA/AmiB activator)